MHGTSKLRWVCADISGKTDVTLSAHLATPCQVCIPSSPPFFFSFQSFPDFVNPFIPFHPILNRLNCFHHSIYFCRSHFHEVFIPKLLSTALKEYTASQSLGGISGEASVMTPTMVQVLAYLSLQHSQEIKSNLLTLFHVS